MEDLYKRPLPLLSVGWFITRVFTTSAGVPKIAATAPDAVLLEKINFPPAFHLDLHLDEVSGTSEELAEGSGTQACDDRFPAIQNGEVLTDREHQRVARTIEGIGHQHLCQGGL